MKIFKIWWEWRSSLECRTTWVVANNKQEARIRFRQWLEEEYKDYSWTSDGKLQPKYINYIMKTVQIPSIKEIIRGTILN